jgi:rod shape-determining protein MreC
VSEKQRRIVRTLLIWILLEVVAAAQVRSSGGQTVLGTWLRTLARPVAACARCVSGFAVDISWVLRDYVVLVAENRTLRTDLEASRAHNSLLSEDLEALREASQLPVLGADLNLGSIAARCRFRNIARGRMEVAAGLIHAVRRDTPAVSAGGLIGRVVNVENRHCWLELITHPAAAVAVRTEDGTVQGLAVGTGSTELSVEFVPRRASLLRGTLLVTSGAEGIYPSGIAVARVRTLRESTSSFLEVTASPTADLSRLRVVLLLPEWAHRHDRGSSR